MATTPQSLIFRLLYPKTKVETFSLRLAAQLIPRPEILPID